MGFARYLNSLSSLYFQDAQFVFKDEELNYYNFMEKLKYLGYYKFTHNNMNINTQAIGPNNLLINVIGLVSINDSIYQNKFIETIFLQKDNNNKFITNFNNHPSISTSLLLLIK